MVPVARDQLPGVALPLAIHVGSGRSPLPCLHLLNGGGWWAITEFLPSSNILSSCNFELSEEALLEE